jgi:ribosomal-protein-alanine N-acetyltransferase
MTDQQISIALAKAADARRIALLSRDLIEHGLEWSWRPERVAASVSNPQANVVVACIQNQVIGFGIMRYGDDEGHLDLLGVREDWRRRGLGRRLVDWLEKPALLGGLAAILLEVRAGNLGAQAFYERLGYRRLENIRGYYQGRESATRMRHDLGSRLIPSQRRSS